MIRGLYLCLIYWFSPNTGGSSDIPSASSFSCWEEGTMTSILMWDKKSWLGVFGFSQGYPRWRGERRLRLPSSRFIPTLASRGTYRKRIAQIINAIGLSFGCHMRYYVALCLRYHVALKFSLIIWDHVATITSTERPQCWGGFWI